MDIQWEHRIRALESNFEEFRVDLQKALSELQNQIAYLDEEIGILNDRLSDIADSNGPVEYNR